jgi:hypothetical protein
LLFIFKPDSAKAFLRFIHTFPVSSKLGRLQLKTRVARFLLAKHTKTGKKYTTKNLFAMDFAK